MKYKYKAKSFDGKEKSEIVDVADLKQLAGDLKRDGYILLDVEPADGDVGVVSSGGFSLAKFKLGDIQFFKRVKLDEKMIFSRNLSVMVGAGLSVSRALEALMHGTKNEYFKATQLDILEQVKKGTSLKDCFASHPDIFNSLYVAMVEAGEESGKLESSLSILAKQMQTDSALVKRVKGAMTYPLVVLAVMVLIGVAMMIYVVPILVQTFEELEVDLPPTTQVIVFLSKTMRTSGPILLGALVLIGYGLKRAFSTERGKRMLDTAFIKAPVVSGITRQFNTARAARTLASLLESGVPISGALDITSRVIQNHYFADVLIEAKTSIQKGEKLSSVFTKYPDLYSSLMSEMLAVGEETGATVKMLDEVASFYESEVEASTKNLSTIIEPLMMVIIGFAVGFFAISMIQPLYSVMNQL